MSADAQTTIADAKKNMQKALDTLEKNFGRVRTGRASLTLVDGIKVDYYGTPTPLAQVATLSIPEPRMIVVQPWEAKLVPAIERAIQQSEMDLNPINDGKLVRIPIPKLSEERRKDLAKVVKGMTEDARVAIRNIRRDANAVLEKLQKDKILGEDELKRSKDEIQKVTDEHVQKADKAQAKKEAEIMEV